MKKWLSCMLGFNHVQSAHTYFSWQAFGGASVPTLLAAMTSSDLWGLADMDSVVSYLLTNRHVDMPPTFRDILVQGLNCP